MPRFLFQVQSGPFPKSPAIEDVLCDSHAARQVALQMCADLARDIVAKMTDDSEWRLEVLNEAGRPVFRLRVLTETLEPAA